jgi:3-methyladenine DNA glycosylase/8-oxoguanine DNA glycosylase
METLLPAIIGQKVTTAGARASWSGLMRLLGEPAPGPVPLTLPPDPRRLRTLRYHAFHPLNIERKRAETLIAACTVASRLEEAAGMSTLDALDRLQSVRGIGPWTATVTLSMTLGDPDLVVLGDYHLPNMVSWALAGEPRGDDYRMAELLQPYVGNRGRVVRLVLAAGIKAPRYGPRLGVRDITGQ